MATKTLTKADVAIEQLNDAITLYFCSGHISSIHTLAAASFTVIEDVLKGTDFEKYTLTNRALLNINSDKHHYYLNLFRKTQNFLKHADRDKDKQHTINSDQTETILFYAAFLSNALMATTKKVISYVKYPNLPTYIFWFMFNNKNLFSANDDNSNVRLDLTIKYFFPDFPAPLNANKKSEYYKWCHKNIPALLQRVLDESIEPFLAIIYSSITVLNELTKTNNS